MPRGINLNNPGNIDRTQIAWSGMDQTQDDPRFIRFTTPEYGIRALMKILISYQEKYNIDTVSGIINRWAPSAENDTGAYVSDVANRCGVSPTDHFDVSVPDNLIRIAQAIAYHENGACPDDTTPYWYSDDVYEAAAKLALG